jgi:ribosomal protein S1
VSQSNAWDRFVARYHVGDVVDGRVTKVVPFGALMEVADGVPGLLVGERRPEAGSTVPVRIKEIDAERQRVSLSAV